MNKRNYNMLVLCAFVLGAAMTAGCGGGNALFSNRDGDVIHGELTLDSIPRQDNSGSYRIGYGDALDIVFLYNSELTRIDVKVRPDGRMSYPHVGEIDVAGMNVTELEHILNERFSEIIRDPKITVMVRSFQDPVVYIMGEVNDPGAYSAIEGKTLLRALTMASGVSPDSKRNGVLVIRRVAPDHIVGVQIDLTELLDDNHYELDIPIEPYDIVYVPKSKLSTVEDFTTSLYNIMAKPADLYIKGWQAANQSILFDFYKRSGPER